MISAILGKKIGMTQIYRDGICIPVTVIKAGPCTVLQVKTQEKDGYQALQIGYEAKKLKRASKAEIEHAKKHANTEPKQFVREVKWDGKDEDIKAGSELTLQIFDKIDYVDVIGTSKGKGFQGGMKRHNFGGGRKTHGQSDRWRSLGSIGCSATPARVVKGKKMAGQMGNVRCTVRNSRVIDIDLEHNIIAIRGTVPGPNNGYVVVRRSLKNNIKKSH